MVTGDFTGFHWHFEELQEISEGFQKKGFRRAPEGLKEVYWVPGVIEGVLGFYIIESLHT